MRPQAACFCLTLFFGALSPGEAAAPSVPGDVLGHASDTVSFRGTQNEAHEVYGAPVLRSQIQSETLSHPAQKEVTASYVSESPGSSAAAFAPTLLLSSHKADASSTEPSPRPPTGDQDRVTDQSIPSRPGDESARIDGNRHGVAEELKPAGAGEHMSVINEPDTVTVAPLTVDAFFSEESYRGWGLVPHPSGRTLQGGTSSGAGAPQRTLREARDDDVDSKPAHWITPVNGLRIRLCRLARRAPWQTLLELSDWVHHRGKSFLRCIVTHAGVMTFAPTKH